MTDMSQPAPAAPAGWYAVHDGTQRYWDGAAWAAVDASHLTPGVAGPDDDTVMGMIGHLLSFQASFLGPLVLWFLKKDKSPYIAYHAKEAMNFQITILIYLLVSIPLFFVSIELGLGFLVLLYLFGTVATLWAAYVAKKGRSVRYPLTLRLVR